MRILLLGKMTFILVLFANEALLYRSPCTEASQDSNENNE